MTTAARPDVLIVDDTPANLHVLAVILTKQGYRVRTAITGDLALKAAQKSAPDIILLDIQMPGMSGYEVCRALKAAEATRHVPVIFISGLEDALDKVEAFRAGGVDYITKPFQIEEVLARVEHQLALQRRRTAGSAASESAAAILGAVAALRRGSPEADALLDQIDAHARAIQAALAEAPASAGEHAGALREREVH